MINSVSENILRKINSAAVRLRAKRWRYDPRGWMSNLEDVQIDRPIFLLGTQGGGLTLVSRMLRRNRSVVSVTGNYKYWNGPDEMQNVLVPILPTSLQLKGRKELFRHGGWTYATNKLIDDFREDAGDVSREDAEKTRTAIRRVLAVYGAKTRKSRFLDKSQSYTVKVKYVNEILKEKNPYFLLVTRNPYVCCYRAAKKTNLSKLDLSFKESLRWAAQHWVNSMKYALRDGKEIDNFLILKIEDILNEVESKIKEICDFLGLNFNHKMIPSKKDTLPFSGIWDEKWYPLRRDINEKYSKKIDKEVVDILEDEGESVIKRLGY